MEMEMEMEICQRKRYLSVQGNDLFFSPFFLLTSQVWLFFVYLQAWLEPPLGLTST
jgi:hypothetical protein